MARGDQFPDALCAAPLAKKYSAPLLVTQFDQLNSDILNEIKRLGATHVIIVGGTGAISKNVENTLNSAGISNIERIAGVNRYETSVKIAEKLGDVSQVAFATGLDFPDALSFSAIAAAKGIPILLTNKDSIPDSVKKYLSGKKITKSYILGGTGVIADNVLKLVPNPLRIGGKDRFETNVEVLKTFADDLNYNNVYIAVVGGQKGDEFTDALSGSVLASKTFSPVILVNGSLPDCTRNYIKTKLQPESKVVVLGDETAVSQATLNDVLLCINTTQAGTVYDKPQTYGPETGVNTVAGNAAINVADVTLKNTVIEGNLLLGEGIGNGNVTLENVTVKGKTIVKGGGPNSIVLINFNGGQVLVDIPDGHSVRLVAEGSTSVNSVSMNTNGKIEESNVTGSGFTNVVIPEGASVTLDGDFDNVDVQSEGVNVQLNSGSIKFLNVGESAADAIINLANGTNVSELGINAAAKVSGTGTIQKATINSEGVTIAQQPVQVTVKDGITASVGQNIPSTESTQESENYVRLSKAKFNGLTEIVVNTNKELKGIAEDNIIITKSDGSVVPSNKITNIIVDSRRLTVDIEADQFVNISSVGTTIATKAFGTHNASKAVAVAQSGDPLTSDVWENITDPNPGGDSMWHNITSDTAVRVDKTEYKGTDGSTYYKQIGKLKALMVVVDFPDMLAKDNTGVNALPGKTPKDAGNRINGHVLKTAQDYYDYLVPRANDYFNASSYGNLDFDVTLVKSDSEEDGGVFTCKGLLYGENEANGNKPYNMDRGGDVDSYVKDALTVASPKLKDYPGGPYDVIYVVAAENCVGISYGPTDTWGDNANAWSGRTDFNSLVRIGYDSYSGWRSKAVNHETGHDLGLVDYYINGFSGPGGGQCDPNTGTVDYYPMVGHWNIMGYINGPAPDIMGWDKWRLGWIRDDQVDIISSEGTTVHQITPLETSGGTKLILIPGPTKGVAYVLEYRQVAGADDTTNLEKSTDPNPNFQNTNWTHSYGTFNSPGILMYKVDFNVPTLNGPLTVVDLYPENATKELGTQLDSSVLGTSSGIYSYTDSAAGITIKLDKETSTVDTLTISNNPPAAAVKPVLSGARFIDLNTIEFKTNVDLRGIYKDSITVKKGNAVINGITINQITPKTIRVTYENGQFADASETSNVTVSTSAFSYYGASDAVSVVPLTALAGPALSEAKFNSLTEIQVKSDVDLTGIEKSNIIIAKEDGSVISSDKITNASFDAASKILKLTINADQFTSNDQTIGVTIATACFSTYKPAGRDLVMAKYNPPVKVFNPGAAVFVEPIGIKLQSIDITTQPNRTIYATGDLLDINGMVVTGTYDNNSTHVIPVTKANVTGFDSSVPCDSQTLTVTVGGKNASYTVAIKDKSQFTLQSIEITTPASKTFYSIGEKLDISGMVVKGVFTGNIEQILTITPANISGFDSTKPYDNQILTITYDGKTATYGIKVAVVSDSVYYKFVNKATKKVMEVNEGNVDQWWDYTTQYDPTVAEWKFIDQRNGYYKIVNKGYLDRGYLETIDGSTEDGADVVFGANKPLDGSDLWSIKEVANGYYKIINKKSSKAIEVLDSNNNDGAEVGINTYTGSDNQLWKIGKVEQLTLDGIKVTTPPDIKIYKVGESLNISGIEVKGNYSDGSQQSIVVKPEDVTGFDSSKADENQTLTVTYENKTAIFNVTIKDPSEFVLQSIEITSQPAKKTYNIGDTLDISGMVVTGTYTMVTGTNTNDVKQVVPVTSANITGFDSKAPAVDQTLTVTYEDKTATYTVIIKDPIPVSIEVTKLPDKTIYLIGETLNIKGLEVTGTYNDGSTEVLPIIRSNITGFSSSKAVENKVLTVTYKSRKTTFNVSIKDPKKYILQSIEITTLPNKILYSIGDTLDISGMVVTGNYSDGTKLVLPIKQENVSGFDSSSAGSKTLTVTYNGKTTDYIVKVLDTFNPDAAVQYNIINKGNNLAIGLDQSTYGGITALKLVDSEIAKTAAVWKFIDKKDGFYAINDVSTNKLIEIWGGGTSVGSMMILWDDYGSDSQIWSIVPVDETHYKIVNKKSNLVLDIDNNGYLIQETYTGADTQLWEIDTVQ